MSREHETRVSLCNLREEQLWLEWEAPPEVIKYMETLMNPCQCSRPLLPSTSWIDSAAVSCDGGKHGMSHVITCLIHPQQLCDGKRSVDEDKLQNPLGAEEEEELRFLTSNQSDVMKSPGTFD